MYLGAKIITKNKDLFEKISDAVAEVDIDLMSTLQEAVYEHIQVTMGLLPAEIKGKVTVKFHPVFGKGYIVDYVVNNEGSQRLTIGEKPLFIPNSSGPSVGKYGDRGYFVSKAERPAVTETATKKLKEIIPIATAHAEKFAGQRAAAKINKRFKSKGVIAKLKNGVSAAFTTARAPRRTRS